LDASGDIVIESGQLSGSGVVEADLFNSGTIGKDGVIERITLAGDYTQTEDGAFSVEFGSNLNEYDGFDVLGVATLDGTLDIFSWEGFEPLDGATFDILSADTILGEFAFLDFGGQGFTWDVSYILDGAGTDYVRLTVSSVPIPAAAWLFGSALLGLAVIKRKKA
jgi:hypothetical protein